MLTPLTGERGVPKFAVGTTFTKRSPGNTLGLPCTVVDILRTYNAAGELVRIRYVTKHQFMGQAVTDYDVVETTIARGLVSEPAAEPAPVEA